uniref:GRIP domain-containing protein n=1 Tax=Elaeophora elaphi TaxID=1147741 RepID=A0A0R3RHD9_9BILA
MSGTSIDVSASTSGTMTPRSKLDALSRDDLIRFVKKQIDKLKTAKCENEKLKTELAEVRKDFTEADKKLHDEQEKNTEKTEEIQQLNEQCNDLKMECSELALKLEKLEAKLKEHQKVDESAESNKLNSNSNDSDGIPVDIVQLQNELASIKDLLRKETEECDKQAKEKEKLTVTINELRSLLDDAYAQLESYKQKKSVENVITLEMADFEKTVERLQKELKAVKLEKNSLRSKLEASMKEMDNIREEKAHLNDNIMELSAALKEINEEMEGRIFFQKKKAELAFHEKERKDLTEQLQKQVSAGNKERDQLITVIGVNEEKIGDLEALNASLNRQLSSLCSQRESLQRQFDDLSEEHSTFKTRALYVLEQKKNDDDERSKGEIEILEETIRQQKRTIDNLTLSEQRQEFESRSASEARLNNELLAQIDAISISHNQEKQNLLMTAQQKREGLEEEMKRLKRMLNEEVARRKEMEKIQVAVSAQNVAVQLQKASKNILPSSTYLIRPAVDAADTASKDVQNDDNEEKSLEQVIYGETEELVLTDIRNQPESFTTPQGVIEMISRQLEHTRELLNESEATNARLVEQTKLLKEEIRKMERDRERENHLTNTEYLKNVIMKFIAPEKVTDERGHLIPVLTTMLKLNSDEVSLLNQVVEGTFFLSSVNRFKLKLEFL